MAFVGDLLAELLLSVVDLMGSDATLTDWVRVKQVRPWQADELFALWMRGQAAGSSFGYSVLGAAEAAFLREQSESELCWFRSSCLLSPACAGLLAC